MQTRCVLSSIRLETPEEQGISLFCLHRQTPLGTGAHVILVLPGRGLRGGEYSLTASFRSRQVHEHGCNTLPAFVWSCIELVVEKIIMCLILLPLLVVQNLQPLALVFRYHASLCYAPLNIFDDLILCFLQKSTRAGTDTGGHTVACRTVYNCGCKHCRCGQFYHIVGLLFRKEVVEQKCSWSPSEYLHSIFPVSWRHFS
mmetsp:Transcript_10710/g.12536  ORF Transcript_10710/g.12536 Transcript_10710/m.12536 type:complete len:200 (-) Transcript_10710:209-808(-)